MLHALQQIILDAQELPLATGVPRRLRVEPVPGKATVCVGVRRSGKSTYIHQRIQALLDAGVPRSSVLYINFFDDRLHALRRENLGLIMEAYYALYPEKKNAERVYCFFDEIQAVPGWESFVDRVMRTEMCEVWLTGSSADLLSREIATQMRGRAIAWEIFPFSFREFLDAQGIPHDGPTSTKGRLLIQRAFEHFWQTGGFPEVVTLERGGRPNSTNAADSGTSGSPGHDWTPRPHLRIKIHQEYLNTLLFRDIIERHDIAHPRAVTDLAHWLIDNTASLYSVNRLAGHLKSLGHHTSRLLVSDFLAWFEDAYFLHSVPIFDASFTRRQRNPKKIYCVDHALVASSASGILVNSGRLLENIVHNALRRVHKNVHYLKTAAGKEVDFVVPLPGGAHRLVQVSETLAHPDTRKRELDALSGAMAGLACREGTIVTRSEEGRVELPHGVVSVVPAWRFLLDLPDVPE